MDEAVATIDQLEQMDLWSMDMMYVLQELYPVLLLIAVLALVLGILLGNRLIDWKIRKTHKKREGIILAAENKAQRIIAKSEKRADRIIDSASVEIDKQRNRLEKRESTIETKETKLDEKEHRLSEQKELLAQQRTQAQTIIQEQTTVLEKLGGLSADDARLQLIDHIKQTANDDLARFIEKTKNEQHLAAKETAINVITSIMPKIAQEYVGEFTSVLVDLPSEQTKGRIIGREGRNILFFERLCGVELIIDDTPLTVKIASHDHEKRYVAQQVLERLIKDGRINPAQIEKVYDEVLEEFANYVLEQGKKAFLILNLAPMHEDVMMMVGQFYFRYSYGQNLRQHSVEVAKIAGLMAEELGLDGQAAKRAGLLHDIGKVVAGSGESHTVVGGQVLRQYSASDIVINAAESHHYDVPMTHPIAWIVSAADTISASTPGARFDSKEIFIERMQQLEELIMGEDGVQKTYIMQAGREIMVFLEPEETTDADLHTTLQTIAKKIEAQLDYPGMIRLVGVRETKMTHYVR